MWSSRRKKPSCWRGERERTPTLPGHLKSRLNQLAAARLVSPGRATAPSPGGRSNRNRECGYGRIMRIAEILLYGVGGLLEIGALVFIVRDLRSMWSRATKQQNNLAVVNNAVWADTYGVRLFDRKFLVAQTLLMLGAALGVGGNLVGAFR
jgi:hypothetical protein